MTMESFATSYPVMFHDGEKEHNKGYIGVHSVLTFKRFQSLLCQKVGLPSGQMTAVLVCRRTSKDAVSDIQEKLPINENTNFSIILNQHNPKWEKDCHFLVTAKKWKKERKGTIGRRRSTDQEESGEEFMICHSKGYSSDNVQKDVNLMAGSALVNCINTKQSIASETMSSSSNVEDMRDILRTPDDRFERMPLMTGRGYNYVARNVMVNMQQSVDHLNLNCNPQQLNLSTDGHGSSEINILSSQTKQERNNWSHGADNYANLQCMSNSRFTHQKASQERRTRPSLIPDNLSSTASLGVPENHQGIIMSSDSASHANLMASHHFKLLNRPDQKILLTRGDQQAALMNPSSLISTMATNIRFNEKAYSMEKQLGGANMASVFPGGPGGVCSFYPRQALQDGVKPWLRHHTVDQHTVLLRDDHGYKPWQSGHYHHNIPVKASEEFQERYSDPLLTTRPSLIQARDGLLKPINVRKDDQMMHPSPGFPSTVGGNNNNVFLLKNPGPVAAGTDLQQAHAHYWGHHPMNNPMIPHRQSLAAVDLHPSIVNSKPGVNVTLDMSKITGLVCSLNSNYQANGNRKSLSSSSSSTTTTTGLAHGGVSCQQCYKFQQSKINPPPFHLCVQDKITVGFRGPSPAGPIGRPMPKTSANFIAAA